MNDERSETRISYTIKLWLEKPTGMKSSENIMLTSGDNTEMDITGMQWKALVKCEVYL